MGKIRTLEQIMASKPDRKAKALAKDILRITKQSTKVWKKVLKTTKKYLKHYGKKERTRK